MSNIVIRNNNIDLFLFENEISFDGSDDIDKYISEEIISKLLKHNFDRVFIKDNLSSNYLELVGLRVAYHIRLSQKLGEKRFVPIIILSDLDSHTLNKFDPMARILFTKNIFIISNTKDEIEKFKTKKLKQLSVNEYQEKFLNLITIEAPKDYTDHHDITNEWAIHQWSNTLGVHSNAIEINHTKIASILYFKYLQSLHISEDSHENYEIKSTKKWGKILYIDDEWSKGWSDILNTLFSKSENIEFTTFEHNYQDANKAILIPMIKGKVKEIDPDIVILDLRLVESDHNEKDNINTLTGIQLTEKIKEINPGIQIIMLTATRQSIILEKLYDYGILGYIKKEHPDDHSVNTVENMDKLVELVDAGLQRKYLKDIYVTQSKIETILENDIFAKYIDDEERYEQFWIHLGVEVDQVFDILSNSDSKNKFKYAMVSIASSLEAILKIFIIEKRNESSKYWDEELCEKCVSLNTKLHELFYEKFGYKTEDKHASKLKMRTMIDKRNKYLHSREEIFIGTNEVVSWFNKLLKMIEIIENPPDLHSFDNGNR